MSSQHTDTTKINSNSEIHFPDPAFRASVSEATGVAIGEFIPDYKIWECEKLDLYGEQFSSLQGIEFLTRLRTLTCYWANLTSVDLSSNTVLRELKIIGSRQLKSLDVTMLPYLESLDCTGCREISEIDVTKNTELTSLEYSSTKIKDLDFTKCTKLERLDCSGTLTTSTLDVSTLPNLKELHCCDNNLTSLDVSKNTELQKLDCRKTSC